MPINNYRKRLRRMIKDGAIRPERGKVTHVVVSHDDWCSIFKSGPCNCNPSIKGMPARSTTRGENGK